MKYDSSKSRDLYILRYHMLYSLKEYYNNYLFIWRPILPYQPVQIPVSSSSLFAKVPV